MRPPRWAIPTPSFTPLSARAAIVPVSTLIASIWPGLLKLASPIFPPASNATAPAVIESAPGWVRSPVRARIATRPVAASLPTSAFNRTSSRASNVARVPPNTSLLTMTLPFGATTSTAPVVDRNPIAVRPATVSFNATTSSTMTQSMITSPEAPPRLTICTSPAAVSAAKVVTATSNGSATVPTPVPASTPRAAPLTFANPAPSPVSPSITAPAASMPTCPAPAFTRVRVTSPVRARSTASPPAVVTIASPERAFSCIVTAPSASSPTLPPAVVTAEPASSVRSPPSARSTALPSVGSGVEFAPVVATSASASTVREPPAIAASSVPRRSSPAEAFCTVREPSTKTSTSPVARRPAAFAPLGTATAPTVRSPPTRAIRTEPSIWVPSPPSGAAASKSAKATTSASISNRSPTASVAPPTRPPARTARFVICDRSAAASAPSSTTSAPVRSTRVPSAFPAPPARPENGASPRAIVPAARFGSLLPTSSTAAAI
ncbi:hypothetical protein LzC2_26290 [Planctomycetes bacterium LzC2]|uniref:Uncharacterized protein n=1 Tax=Alienimonas chondri TaxID=2681879 RepID=A0ABX1VG65_9PLAN|nr:hypothetical protein [Alienimonas chondri]